MALGPMDFNLQSAPGTDCVTAKNVLIISPRLAIQKGDFLGSGVPYWPLEAAIFASVWRESYWEVSILDLFGMDPARLTADGSLYWQGMPLQEAVSNRAIRLQDYDWVLVYAISCMSHQELLGIVKSLKSLSARHVVVFENSQAVTGYDLTETIPFYKEAGADYLLIGEPYSNWEKLKGFFDGTASAPPANLIDLHAASPVPAKRFTQNPIHTPVPAWDLFPFENYWKLPYSHGPKKAPYFPMLTSRGCPYPCTFCVVPATNEQRWRARSAEEVVAEMVNLHHKYGVLEFQWEDLNSTIDRARVQAIGHLLVEKKLPFRFRLVSGTKVETLDVPTLDAMAEGGCDYISISPESGSPQILQKMRKPFDHAHALQMVKAMHERGIHSQACFVLGHPEETEADRAATESYVKQMVRAGVDEVAFFILSPLPGSALQNAMPYGNYEEALWSFSPRHRTDYKVLEKWRQRLIRRFFFWKLVFKPGALLRQMWNAFVGRPFTKMEMLPRRVLYILRATKSS